MWLALTFAVLSFQLDDAALRAAVARDAQDVDARYRLGLVLYKQRKLDESARYLDEAARLAPGEVMIWRAVALVRSAGHDGLGEARALQTILELEPADLRAHRRLANLLLDYRTADGALAVTGAALRRFPADAELLRLRGLALYALGQRPEAIDAFLAAIDAAPDSEFALASLETLIPEAGQQLPAIAERVQRFTTANPVSPLGHFLLALTGEPKEARLRQSIAADSTFWPAHFELGRRLRDQGRVPAAIESFANVLELHATHEGAHFALSMLYAQAGDRERARVHREAHHQLRAQAAEAEQKRNAAAPRIQVTVR